VHQLGELALNIHNNKAAIVLVQHFYL
jgi:hypothetical protein